MSIVLSALQRQRRDTAANWTAQNPTLLAGEIGIESDTLKWKVGDGIAAWNSLAYIPGLSISAYPIVDADIASDADIAVSKLARGTARQLLQTDAAGTSVEFASNIAIPGTLEVAGDVVFQGDLTVNGTETIINTQTLAVEDKNIELGKVASPTDTTADGGGITLKGDTDKTINWIDATDAWTFSEHVDLASGKEYRINGAQVLTGTALGNGVTSSSLTSVGTLTAGALGAGFTTVATGQGGTGQTTYTDGELLIGKTDGTLAKATLTASTGVTITNGDGSITISATGTGGTVTDVTATSPLASTGGTTPDISIQDGTTAQKGAVQLEDSTTSSSTTTAATPASVKAAFDLADAALPKAGGTLTGDVTLDNQSDLRFGEATANGTNYVAFQAPTSIAADVTWTLPDVDGSAGESLTTDGAGVLGWSALAIADGSITDAKIASNAAIAGTKISPDFGSQNVVTTGTSTAASLIPTGSSVPANGVYLPAANELAIATNTTEGVRINSSGKLLSPNGAAFFGTVTNSGNGAIMEHGSNANGQFIKYADGTQICYLNRFDLDSGTIAHRQLGWTLPASFVDAAYVVHANLRGKADGDGVGTANADAAPAIDQLMPGLYGNKSTTAVTIRFSRVSGGTNFGTNDILYAGVTAIGRWY